MAQCKRNQLNSITLPGDMYKMWSDFAVSGQRQNIPIILHILDVFSGLGDQIDMIPFALCQGSQDTSLATYISENFEFPLFGGLTPLEGPSKTCFGKNKSFSDLLCT
jgi:hypothetical protein